MDNHDSVILIVEDDPTQQSDLAGMVASLGHQVLTAADGAEALEKLRSAPINVVLTDLVMPGMDGLELLRQLAAIGSHVPAVVLTGFGSVEQAISIVHDYKAFWFIEKPLQLRVLAALLERAIQRHRLSEENALLTRQLSEQGTLGELVGDSPAMREIFALIRQLAPTQASVLITGESGTGKELVARAIHNLSPRGSGPFVAVNCAALPDTLIESELFGHEKGAFTGAVERRPGCFERAQNGTLLLDEIAEMPVNTQASLLRVLEERKVRRLGGAVEIPVSVRVLAATNRSPARAVEEKKLREDLFYRLNVFHIALPPLRERREDIVTMVGALIRELNKKHNCAITQLSPAALERLEAYSWPGNVRELRNVLERAAILAGKGDIDLSHLPRELATIPLQAGPISRPQNAQNADGAVLSISIGAAMKDVEESYIRAVLKHTGNDKKRAAEILGLSIRTLYTKVHAFANAGKPADPSAEELAISANSAAPSNGSD